MVSSNVREGAASTMTTMFRIDPWNWGGNPSKASATSCSNSRRRTSVLLRLVHGFDRFLHQWSLLLLLPEAILPYPVLGRMSSSIGGSAAPPPALVEHDGDAQHRIAQRWHPQLEEETLGHSGARCATIPAIHPCPNTISYPGTERGQYTWRGNSHDGCAQSAPHSAMLHYDSHHCSNPSYTGCGMNCGGASVLATPAWCPILIWYALCVLTRPASPTRCVIY